MLADLEELGMSTLSLEVTNEENIRRVMKEVEGITGGRLDILVNNAYVLIITLDSSHIYPGITQKTTPLSRGR